MSQPPPNTLGWTIGVNVPETTDDLLPKKLLLQNKAVATSGDAYQYIEHNGKRYSHIADPRTGYGISSQRNVTVIADNGALADWLATACSILSIKEAMQLAKKMKAELLITELRNKQVVYYDSPGFKMYWKRWMKCYIASITTLSLRKLPVLSFSALNEAQTNRREQEKLSFRREINTLH